MILQVLAAVLLAGDVTVHLTASRQDSISQMRVLRQMRLSVYEITACADGDVGMPAGRIYQALHDRGIPTESSALVPFMMARASNQSVRGLAIEGAEYGGGLLAILQAAGTIAAGPYAPIAPSLAMAVSRLRGRGKQNEDLIVPLAGRVLRSDETLALLAQACETRFIVSGKHRWSVEPDMQIRVTLPPASIARGFRE